MQRRDYLSRMIEQLAAVLARVAGHKARGENDTALVEVQASYGRLLGLDAGLLRLDTASVARIVGDRQKLKVMAQLLAEEADLLRRQGHLSASASKARRAVEFHVEALGTSDDEAGEQALRSLDEALGPGRALLAPRYLAALDRLRQREGRGPVG